MKSKGVFVRGPAQTPVRDRSSARIRGVAWRCVGAAAVLMTGLQLASAQMSLPGKFSVNNQGAATFSVSIAVPPGTAGMIPALTLDYTSQSTSQTGGGLLGIGWSLGGLLSITHCPKTVTQDGGFGGVNFDANDRYCLDGQRLVAISGGYGADGTEYRTEVESFSRVISHGVAGSAPQWWEVHTKTGQVMEFGHTADSALVLHNQSSVFGWALSKMSDTKGNYYTITYTNDATNGQVYPIEIDYTGNAAASLAPYNKVQFVYATRPDVTPQYVAGSLNQITVRLTDVKTYADTSLVADYRLGYRQMTMSQASQLTSITLCASDGSCLPATFLAFADDTDWQLTILGQGYGTGTTLGTPPRNYGSIVTGDFDGDGKTDYLYANATNYVLFRSNGDGTFAISGAAYGSGLNLNGTPPTANYDLVVGDFNGDGKTDFAFVGSTVLFSFISRGDGTFAFVGQGYPSGTTLGSPPRNYGSVITGDFNGDGKTDFVYANATNYVTFRSNGDGTFAISGAAYGGGINLQGPPPTSIYDLVVGDFNGDGKTDFAYVGSTLVFSFISRGDGTFTASGQGYPTGTTLGSPPRNYGNVITGDFNGDGKTDFVYTNSTNYVTFRSNGDGTFAISGAAYGGGINLQGPPPTSVYDLVVGDFNGDGKTDFAYVGNQLQFSFLSKGDGSFSILGQGYPGGTTLGSPPRNYGTIITGDFNGDGKSDFAYVNNTNYVIFRANGDGTFGLAGAADGGGINLLTPPTGNYDLVVGDFNGDGKTDFAFVGSTLQFSFRSDGAPYSKLTSVTTGLGQTTSIQYQPLTNSSVYAKDANAVYPLIDLNSPLFVVSQVTAPNGIGGTYLGTYSYAGAKFDTFGRGFLGFRQTKTMDPQTNIVQTTNFRQDFPYLGMVSSTLSASGAQTLSQTSNTLQFLNSGGTASLSTPSVTNAPYRVSVAQSVTSGADLDGSTLPTTTSAFTYDAYNNATQIAVSVSDGSGKTTTNTFTNDATNWLLGRLTSSSVTSQIQ